MKRLFFFSILFILSRLFFLNPQPVFFDSPEYLFRLANPDFLQALASGHPPYHAGYIALFWPLVRLGLPRLAEGETDKFEPALIVEIVTVFLGFLTVFFFYKLVKNLFNAKVSFWSAVLVSLTPYFWITNVSVMVETPYIFFFILSLYLFVRYLKTNRKRLMIISALSFGLAYFIHTIVIVWVTTFFAIWLFVKNKKKNFNFLIIVFHFIFFIFIFYFLNSLLLYYSHLFSLSQSFAFGLVGKTNEHLSLLPLATLIPRVIRNWLVLLARNNTNLLLILFFCSLFWLWRQKKRKLFWALTLWFLPSAVTNQWWDSVLLGRHAIIASFPIAIAVAHLVIPAQAGIYTDNYLYRFLIKSGMTMIISNLIITSLGALWLLRQPVPYLEQAKTVSQLPANGLLLETHFARPWIKYKGQVIFVNEPGWPKDNLTALIDQNLKNEQPVFTTTQALSDPYGLYGGPWLNPLSLNPSGQSELKDLFDKYSFEKKNQFLWQIKPKNTEEFFYHDFKVPYFSRKRIDYFDPLTQFWFLLIKYF